MLLLLLLLLLSLMPQAADEDNKDDQNSSMLLMPVPLLCSFLLLSALSHEAGCHPVLCAHVIEMLLF